MCTLTFLPINNGLVLTSNRDEIQSRETLLPTFYQHAGRDLIYPKDTLAGGTWIATDGNRRIACLLNGAFEKHTRKDVYAKSRGKILLEAFDYNDHNSFASAVNVEGVEPFTLILVDFSGNFALTEIRWDEKKLHVTELDWTKVHIWSSASLYSKEYRDARERWFSDWLLKHNDEEDYGIWNFHTSRHTEEKESDIVMERDNGVKTVSVTQLQIRKDSHVMYHQDILLNKKVTIDLVNKVIRDQK